MKQEVTKLKSFGSPLSRSALIKIKGGSQQFCRGIGEVCSPPFADCCAGLVCAIVGGAYTICLAPSQ